MKRKLKRKNIKKMSKGVTIPGDWKERCRKIYGREFTTHFWTKYGWAIK